MREYHHPSPTKEPIDRHHYGGQWVAILRRRIIDHDRDLDALCDRLLHNAHPLVLQGPSRRKEAPEKN